MAGKRGRPKGSADKRTAHKIMAQRKGITPLEFLLNVMDDTENDQPVRIDAAKAAAPYVHAKLQSIKVAKEDYDGDPRSIRTADLARVITGAGSKALPAKTSSSNKPH